MHALWLVIRLSFGEVTYIEEWDTGENARWRCTGLRTNTTGASIASGASLCSRLATSLCRPCSRRSSGALRHERDGPI